MITKKLLTKFFNRKNIDQKFIKILHEMLSEFSCEFHLNTKERLALFLGQVKAEIYIRKDGTIRTRESLDYSVASLMRTFSYFRRNPHLATRLGRKRGQRASQVEIANIAYMDRNRSKKYKLGNVKDGDGYLYRGAGILQSTGRENIGLDLSTIHFKTGIIITLNAELSTDARVLEELLSTYTISILLGMAHWERKKIYLKSSTLAVTNVINMGLGQSDKDKRERHTQRAREILTQTA